MTEYAEINSEFADHFPNPPLIYPAHKCDKFTYAYADVFFHKTENEWCLDIDRETGVFIFFCPFCGKELPK